MKNDLISRAEVCGILADMYPTDSEHVIGTKRIDIAYDAVLNLPSAQPKPLTDAEVVICKLYLEDLDKYKACNEYKLLMGLLDGTAYVQPNIIHCNECEYGCQDKYGRWFCRSLGCQIGEEDGSGYCADAERRTDEQTD